MFGDGADEKEKSVYLYSRKYNHLLRMSFFFCNAFSKAVGTPSVYTCHPYLSASQRIPDATNILLIVEQHYHADWPFYVSIRNSQAGTVAESFTDGLVSDNCLTAGRVTSHNMHDIRFTSS